MQTSVLQASIIEHLSGNATFGVWQGPGCRMVVVGVLNGEQRAWLDAQPLPVYYHQGCIPLDVPPPADDGCASDTPPPPPWHELEAAALAAYP